MPIALFSFMPVIMIPDPKMEIEEQVEGNYSIWGSDDSAPREGGETCLMRFQNVEFLPVLKY